MNKKTIKLFSIIILTIILLTICNVSKAVVENKPGGTVHTNINVSDSYQLCYNMRDKKDSSLGNNTLDPHLTTNADWAAVAYLGVSAYGSVRSTTGNAVTINGASYNSTTNNITGVMNMGNTYTQTASLITGHSRSTTSLTNLLNNENTKYVETLGATAGDATNKGKALGETAGWYGSSASFCNSSFPVGFRSKSLGFYARTRGDGYYFGTGDAFPTATFRPVIWN